MNIQKLVTCLGIGILCTSSFILFSLRRQTPRPITGELGFEFELKSEQRSEGVGPPMWSGTVILPKEYYSRENLDRLFRWYSDRHADRGERIQLNVYTDAKNIPQFVLLYTPTSRRKSEEPPESPAETRLVPYDATFLREARGGLVEGGGENELYIFSPDLSKPNEDKRVVVRGRDPFAQEEILETWMIEAKRFKVRIVAYDLIRAEPTGIYYELQCVNRSSDGYKKESYASWEGIMTVQRDGPLNIPREQVRLLNDRIVYCFMGSQYAVTTDGAKSWFVWDAERDLAGCEGCRNSVIDEVQVSPDGGGRIRLRLVSQDSDRMIELQTRDYGRHWQHK